AAARGRPDHREPLQPGRAPARRLPAARRDRPARAGRVVPDPRVRGGRRMSRVVKVAAAQLGPSGTKAENTERMRALLDRAATAGAQIVGFPELSLTPYFPIRNEQGYEQYFEPV